MDNERSEIARYYQEVPEEERLGHGPSRLEFARTQELAARYLPPPPAAIADVGGAAGAYSLWLASLGYAVHLVDASPRLVEEARKRSATAPHPLAACAVGDARALTFGDASMKALLMLGPLYHLTAPADRALALREAHRVLTRGGVLIAAAISRYASMLDGLARDLFADAAFGAIAERDLREGQHRNPTADWNYFTTAYFHLPDELAAEVAQAGFRVEGVFGVEGPGWILPDFDARWNDARQREDLLRVARAFERSESIVGVSAHLLAIGVKA